MKKLRFEWEVAKAKANLKKHGVSFDEARTVFFDEDALMRPAEEHSDKEDRFLLLGLSATPRLVLVCHCYREDESVIRIISARKASRSERRQYDHRRSP